MIDLIDFNYIFFIVNKCKQHENRKNTKGYIVKSP